MERDSSIKSILIIAPHFPPSNLASVHRTRLFAQHLPEFGWKPIVLCVDEKYYEEQLDWNLVKLLPQDLRIEKVKAFNPTKPRIIGDIGLRAFFQLYKRAKQLILTEKIDFLYIPIPSFYIALLGRWLHYTTGVKYGIDYIDPWVHTTPGKKLLSRHGLSSLLANILEPIAIKRASLITGVAEGYYKGLQERNPHLLNSCLFGAMPYGGEEADHIKVAEMNIKPYLFTKAPGKVILAYAGAMLPRAYKPLEEIFKALQSSPKMASAIQIHFIGTGKSPTDPNGFNIKPMAESYGLWQTTIFEYPMRIPYLDVLIHLEAADGVFILGSTEPHYTPSKVYQGVLLRKPLFALLHEQSTAVQVIKQAQAGIVLDFMGEEGLDKIKEQFLTYLINYLDFLKSFHPENVDMTSFEAYSAKNVTKLLVDKLNKLNYI